MEPVRLRKVYFVVMRLIGAIWYVLFFGFIIPLTVVVVSQPLDETVANMTGIGLTVSWLMIGAAVGFGLASIVLLTVSAYALYRCGKGWPWSIGPHVAFNPQCLVTVGPYKVVRHPMADAYLLYLIGIGCLVPSLVMLVWFVPLIGGLLYEYFEYTEEIRLRRWFGEKYEHYHRRTPSLLPRVKFLGRLAGS